MATFNSQNFKIGPCAVIFKGDILGVTRKSSQLNFSGTYHDAQCSRAFHQTLGKRLMSMTISLTVEIMSVNDGLGLFLDENDRITLDKLGERQNPYGGELLLIPISPSDMVAYRFPKAILLFNSACSFNENEEHTLRLQFEAGFVEGEEILFERIPVDEAQRVNLDTSSGIETAAFERAMTAYIADKLGMTVDTDIFRGGIPVNIDGCGVTLAGRQIENTPATQHYIVSFSCINNSRDNVMQTIQELEDKFPVYGETIVIEGEATECKAILKNSSEYNRIISDNGKIKTLGELVLTVII
jgi:hypothetical protein